MALYACWCLYQQWHLVGAVELKLNCFYRIIVLKLTCLCEFQRCLDICCYVIYCLQRSPEEVSQTGEIGEFNKILCQCVNWYVNFFMLFWVLATVYLTFLFMCPIDMVWRIQLVRKTTDQSACPPWSIHVPWALLGRSLWGFSLEP